MRGTFYTLRMLIDIYVFYQMGGRQQFCVSLQPNVFAHLQINAIRETIVGRLRANGISMIFQFLFFSRISSIDSPNQLTGMNECNYLIDSD